METGQLKGILAHRQTEKMIREWGKQRKDLIKTDKSKKKLYVHVLQNGQNLKNILRNG
jgi:hypothetical protein